MIIVAKFFYLLLILSAAAASLAFWASRADAKAMKRARGAAAPQTHQLLAVDTLWSAGGRATGPAIRTPADGPGRSRSAP